MDPCSDNNQKFDEEMDFKRGSWTVEEDFTLINHIALHGEGHWNSLARSAGLKRTGKSCRLRWLNYLRPDVRRGNITLEEQLLILELHSRWGNRWSKIAQHLPGRTDNEIKNYWRTRVQKHAKQLKCDVNSKQFKDTLRYLWIPRLVERIQASNSRTNNTIQQTNNTNNNIIIPNIEEINCSRTTTTTTSTSSENPISDMSDSYNNIIIPNIEDINCSTTTTTTTSTSSENPISDMPDSYNNIIIPNIEDINCSTTTTTTSTSSENPISDMSDSYNNINQSDNNINLIWYGETLISPTGYFHQEGALDFRTVDIIDQKNNQFLDVSDNLWNIEDMWFLQEQLN